jgi:hypothetical protein
MSMVFWLIGAALFTSAIGGKGINCGQVTFTSVIFVILTPCTPVLHCLTATSLTLSIPQWHSPGLIGLFKANHLFFRSLILCQGLRFYRVLYGPLARHLWA